MEERVPLLRIEGMTCGSCARRVNAALSSLDGVESVTVSVREGTALVRHLPDLASMEALGEALRIAGYPLAS